MPKTIKGAPSHLPEGSHGLAERQETVDEETPLDVSHGFFSGKGKAFFFEKKKQKTFVFFVPCVCNAGFRCGYQGDDMESELVDTT